MIVYLESSAALRWLLGAPGGTETFDRLHAATGIGASRLTIAEVRRVLGRQESVGALSAAQVTRCLSQLAAELVRWDILEVSETIWLRAESRFPVEPVRTADAIHLASALQYRAAIGELELLTFDDRVRDNWRALGFAI